MGQIIVFSKSECPHCVAAKTTLEELNIPYEQIDIEESDYNLDLMTLVTQKATVPQLFFNNRHIGGNQQLNQLSPDEIKSAAASAIAEENGPEFITNPPSADELMEARLPLRVLLDPLIPDNVAEMPEYRPVILFYGNLFDALIISYDYMALKPEALSLWASTLIESCNLTMQTSAGPRFYGSLALSFAMPSGCDYCTSHSEERIEVDGSDENRGAMDQLAEHIRGNVPLDDLPMSDQEKALVNIAIRVSSGQLDVSDMERLARAVGTENLIAEVQHLGGMSLLMGMMNRWHDMIGLDRNDHHHEFAESGGVRAMLKEDEIVIPDFNLSEDEAMAQMMQEIKRRAYEAASPYIEKYENYDQSWLPDWIATLPSASARSSIAPFYHSVMRHGELDSDLKHLACYASEKESGFDGIAAEELRILKLTTKDRDSMERRLALTDRHHFNGEFDAIAEIDPELALILELSHYACAMPVFIPGHLTKRVKNVFSGIQVCELILALTGTAMAQRWTPIWKEATDYIG